MLSKPAIRKAFDNKAPVNKTSAIRVRSSVDLTYDHTPFLYDYRRVVRSRTDKDIRDIYMLCCELFLTHRRDFLNDATALNQLVIDRCKRFGCSSAREASIAINLVSRGSDIQDFLEHTSAEAKVVPLYWCVARDSMVLKVGVV